MEHLYDYLGENYPYLLPLDQVIAKEGKLECTTRSTQPQLKEFKKIGQTAASLGSIALLQTMNLSTKTFLLGEKIRIRKINHTLEDSELRYCARAISFSTRKGKALVDIFDALGQLVYTAELEYVIFDEVSFQQVFASLYTEKIPSELDLVYDEVQVNLTAPSYFTIHIPAFTPEQCKGHFDHYPIVPGIFIMHRLLEGIEKFFALKGEAFQGKTLVADSFETFLKKATPTQVALYASVYYRALTKDTYLFICPIQEDNIEYGHYIITVKVC